MTLQSPLAAGSLSLTACRPQTVVYLKFVGLRAGYTFLLDKDMFPLDTTILQLKQWLKERNCGQVCSQPALSCTP